MSKQILENRNVEMVFDIEWFPNIIYSWGVYEQNAIEIIKEGYMMSFSVIINGKQITKGLCDYKGYKGGNSTEEQLVKELHSYFMHADIIIGWNSNKYDIRRANSLFYKYGLPAPSFYKKVDLMLVWNKNFDTNYKSLKYAATYSKKLKIQQKKQNEGFPMWKGCDEGDMTRWKQLLSYNARDTKVTDELKPGILEYDNPHPAHKQRFGKCPKCHSQSYQKKGFEWSYGVQYQRAKCNDCGKNFPLNDVPTQK